MADLMRLEIMYNHGGMYVDTDFECYQSFDGIVRLAESMHKHIIVCSELDWDETIVTNAFMMAKPGCKGIRQQIDYLKQNKIDPSIPVNEATGPYLFGRFCRNDPFLYLKKEMLYMLMPQEKHDTSKTRTHFIQQGSLAIHWWAGSWTSQ
jgi:mannosyltransferase OCH1-like enzyme